MHSHGGPWEREKTRLIDILGERSRFLRPVPCGDAIKSFTESTRYSVSSWWYALLCQLLVVWVNVVIPTRWAERQKAAVTLL